MRITIGAFNWRVSVGDITHLADYQGPDGKLSKESTAAEAGWSLAKPVQAAQVAQWFGKAASAVPAGSAVAAPAVGTLKKPAIIAIVLLLLINVPLWLAADDGEGIFMVTLIACVLLWWPAGKEMKD